MALDREVLEVHTPRPLGNLISRIVAASWVASVSSAPLATGQRAAFWLRRLAAGRNASAASRARGPARVGAWRGWPSACGCAARTGNGRSRLCREALWQERRFLRLLDQGSCPGDKAATQPRPAPAWQRRVAGALAVAGRSSVNHLSFRIY